MQVATQAWKLAAGLVATQTEVSGGYNPIWLVEILGINIFASTSRIYFSRLRHLGDGVLLGGGVLLGDTIPEYHQFIHDGGLGSVTSTLAENDSQPRVSNLDIQLSNTEGLFLSFNLLGWNNAAIRLRLGFEGLGYDDFITIWTGVIDTIEDRIDYFTLFCLDRTFASYPSLNFPLVPRNFPETPQENRGLNIPLILGTNTDVETFRVRGATQGTLAIAMTAGDTELSITEFGLPFPQSGSIEIGTEISVTYARRDLYTDQQTGKTYLSLGGLVRSGTPATHAIGIVVKLANPTYEYLVGFAVDDIQAVRTEVPPVVANPASYNILRTYVPAEVTVISFATTPVEPVSVDVNAGTLQTADLLVNGGFEAGTTSGWTVGAGATVAIETVNPSPQAGTYYVSVEGDENVFKDLYQDVPTIPGDDYLLTFWYQDDNSNLLANGGFEDGDFTDWTITEEDNISYQIIRRGQGRFFPPNPVGRAQTASVRLIPAEGDYALLAFATDPAHNRYHASFSLDVATTIGFTYTLSFWQSTQTLNAGFSSLTSFDTGLFQQLPRPFGGQLRPFLIGNGGVSASYVVYSVGTPAAPTSILARRASPFSVIWRNGRRNFGVFLQKFTGNREIFFYYTERYTFVATGAATRLTFEMNGYGQYDTRTLLHGPAPMTFDGVALTNTSVVETSIGWVQIGTTVDPDAIANLELQESYQWTEIEYRFRATATTTRITLRSSHSTATPRPTYFDSVSLRPIFTTNTNPVEQIRYICRTFLPHIPLNEESFLTAYDLLPGWAFGTVLRTPGDSRALLGRMAAQCNCIVFEDAQGRISIKVRDTDTPAVFGFTRSNIVDGSFTASLGSLEQVYSEYYVYFGSKTGEANGPEDFSAATICTPSETTHTDYTLTSICSEAATRFRTARRLSVFAEFIQDLATANFLLETLVRRHTIRPLYYRFQTWLDASTLEIGDKVQVADPRYENISSTEECEIVGIISATPETPYVTLTVQVFRAFGWNAFFDYEPIIVDSMDWTEDWEV